LNQGAKHRDSAIMTHSLQIVGTRAYPTGLESGGFPKVCG
jgi:hypothetical protein